MHIILVSQCRCTISWNIANLSQNHWDVSGNITEKIRMISVKIWNKTNINPAISQKTLVVSIAITFLFHSIWRTLKIPLIIRQVKLKI